jgi:FAD-dependent oxidoreductase family protein
MRSFLLISVCVLCSLIIECTSPEKYYDIVIYGGTSSGVIAAVQAARMGKTVALVEPGRHLGGLTSGGLGRTDYGHQETIGGLARTFYEKAGRYYQQEIAWDFEPHVAEKVFNDMVREAGPGKLEVILEQRLLFDARRGVQRKGAGIEAIVTESGRRFGGRVFIDATYEGDLMALAGVSYHLGREARDTYGETLAGVLEPGKGSYFQPKQFFPPEVDPFLIPGEPGSGLLPGIQGAGLDKPGAGDRKIQAYNFRVCLTTDPDNRIPFTEPAGYEPLRYELLARWIAAVPNLQLRSKGKNKGILKIDSMPNQKTDINDGCPASTDYIGANWEYPEGDYETRDSIIQQHVDYTKGLLWFLASDPRVPGHIRFEMQKYGYPKDEYIDNGHFSHQLYIREARRMAGGYVMIQQDCQENRRKKDSIGLGSYGVDSHHLQRVVLDGRVVNEGNFLASHISYEIPYRSITPLPGECENLLVPVCLSSSHIAFGSIRMEPVFMILGQSAATAACLAIKSGVSVQNVDYAALRSRLATDNQVLRLTDR